MISLESELVGSTIRQIRPRGSTFSDALFAFANADYESTLQLLSDFDSIEATLLRARSFIRLSLFKRAVGEFETLKLENLGSAVGAEALTLLSLAHIGLREIDFIGEHLATARTLACSSGSVVHEAEVEFTAAFYHFMNGEIDCATNALYRLLNLVSVCSPWKIIERTTQTLDEFRARAYDLLGHIAARDSRFIEQANFIYLAFAELDKVAECDPYIASKLLGNLAVIGADRDVAGVYEYVRDRIATLKFPGACQIFEFEIRRNLGRSASMHGDHIGALREFRRSSEIAPNRASKIKALLDRSSLADELNEFVFANEESHFALELTRQVDWSKVSAGETIALLAMSQNLADRNPVEARRLLDRFGECKRRHNAVHSVTTDLGYAGLECQADALISRAEGNVNRAKQLNLDAFDFFKRVDYIGRAAVVAVEIFELTGEHSYLEYAAAYSEKLPQSHLARRVNAHLNASTLTA